MTIKHLKFLPLLVICLTVFVFQAILTQAANNDYLLNWSANTYTPIDFLGKALPIANSQIALEILPTNSSVSLAPLSYRWFINNKFYRLTAEPRTAFTTSGGSSYKVEVKIIDQNDILIGNKTIFIPIVKPEITASYFQLTDEQTQAYYHPGVDFGNLQLNAKYLTNSILTNNDNNEIIIFDGVVGDLFIAATPYFFNVKKIDELDFSCGSNDNIGKISSQQNYQNIFRFIFNNSDEPFQQNYRVSTENRSYLSEKAETNLLIKFNLTD